MTTPAATPAPAPATTGATLLTLEAAVRLVHGDLDKVVVAAHRTGRPRIPLVARHAATVRDTFLDRLRVTPWSTGEQPQTVRAWAALLDRDIAASEIPLLRDLHRRVGTIASALAGDAKQRGTR